MSAADIVVVLCASAAAASGLAWFFFATRVPHRAVGRQCAAVGRCRARRLPLRRHPTEPGLPVELVFDRQESRTAPPGWCPPTSGSAPPPPRFNP